MLAAFYDVIAMPMGKGRRKRMWEMATDNVCGTKPVFYEEVPRIVFFEKFYAYESVKN